MVGRKNNRRVLYFLLGIVLLAVAALAVLPHAISYSVQRWIMERRVDVVKIEDVDFNPFTATLKIQNLSIEKDNQETLRLPYLLLKVDWMPLWSKRLVIREVELSGVRLQMIQGDVGHRFFIGGVEVNIPSGSSSDAKPRWAVHLNRLSIKGADMAYQGVGVESRLSISKLALSGFASDEPSNQFEISFDGLVDDAPLALRGTLMVSGDHPGMKGRVELQKLRLSPYEPLVAGFLKQVKGQLDVVGDYHLQRKPEGGWIVSYKGDVGLGSLNVQYGEHALSATDQIMWRGTLQSNGATRDAKGSLSTGALTYRVADDSYEHGELLWKGQAGTKASKEGTEWQFAGSLTMTTPAAAFGENRASLERLELKLDESVVRLGENHTELHIKSGFNLKGGASEDPRYKLTHDALTWNGVVDLVHDSSGAVVNGTGELDGRTLGLDMVGQQLAATIGEIQWSGQWSLSASEAQGTFFPSGNVTIKELASNDAQKQRPLLNASAIKLNGLNSSDNGYTAERLAISNLVIGDDAKPESKARLPVLSTAGLTLDTIAFDNERLSIAGVLIEDTLQHLVRQTPGRWNFDDIKDVGSRFSADDSEQQRASMVIQVGQAKWIGDSMIQFVDQTVTPNYKLELKPDQFEITNIDSGSPRQMSGLVLKGKLDNKAEVDLSGQFTPFLDNPSASIKGQLKGFPLPPLSVYSGPLLGYQLESGNATADLELNSEKGVLEGTIDLGLDALEVKPFDKEKMAVLEKQLSIPLDTALGMLKDKHNRIKLKLPISGDMDNIDVDPSDAINQAVGKAMKNGAKTYLATALFPFGTLLTLVEIAGEVSAKMKLDPVVFAPGSSHLDEAHHEYLKKVASILKERQEIHIRVCGVAVEDDRVALLEHERQRLAVELKQANAKGIEDTLNGLQLPEEELVALVELRVQALEKYVAEAHGVQADRLVSCKPKIELNSDEKSEPRIDLLI